MKVSVSGAPLELFLDLGAYLPIALTASEMERSHVQVLPKMTQFRDALGQVMEAHHFLAKDVRLAGYEVGDLEGGEAVSMGGFAPPDRNGYIGRPLLARHLLVLDYPHHRIRFYESGNDAAMTLECGAARFKVELRDGAVQSEGQTEFGRRRFLWDTGAQENNIRPSVLPPEVVAAAPTIDDGPPVVRIEHVALDGTDIGPQGFRLWAFEAPDVDAYLGAGLFSTRKVCLDIAMGRGAVAPAGG
ncbi:MAG TPA: hypothetical protein VH301_08040 [Usitatibacter sp.]|nr:hypothetical protein [Usitatibacter sp.]